MCVIECKFCGIHSAVQNLLSLSESQLLDTNKDLFFIDRNQRTVLTAMNDTIAGRLQSSEMALKASNKLVSTVRDLYAALPLCPC